MNPDEALARNRFSEAPEGAVVAISPPAAAVLPPVTTLVVVELPSSSTVMAHPLLAALPASLQHIAGLIVEGASDREIAAIRGTELATVTKQVRRLFEVLGVDSRFHLVARLCGLEWSACDHPVRPD